MEKFTYDDKTDFLTKLKELINSDVSKKKISTFTPYHVHEVEEMLKLPQSKLRIFALFGALLGTIAGFAFTIFTVFHWPLITSGKPLISIPPFIIIAFALTILFGSLISFTGFLILSSLPSPKNIATPEEYGNQFVILIDKKE
ncbi:MAG: DUF3341 domain-containing protein [bacterium]|nr:MAG: DUF3341 domain-containing protein [bacterium]